VKERRQEQARTAARDAIVDHPAYARALEGARADRSPIDVAVRRRLRALEKSRDAKGAKKNRALAVHLMERGTVSVRVLASVLRGYDAELIHLAAARVDLGSTVDGAGPLHLAARAASSDAVKVLLDRGADPSVPNADGKTARDLLCEAQVESPSAFGVSEALIHFQRAGGGPPKPPAAKPEATEYVEGDAVHHKKLGDGIVEAVTGDGDEAKLKIRFATETRVFLAKFVTPKA
jgi:hypothetical protein